VISVTSHSHYISLIEEGAPLPDIETRLKPLCKESYRRIDRFIQLSLLGSGLCAQRRPLSPDCGLYISTGIGPVGNNIIVQETLFKQRLLPKPFHFVNTLGSSAGYYVCKNLGFTGQSLFISRRGAALEDALACAMVDLELGIVTQALVGAVEESTLPLSDHRQRLELPPGTPVAEGSHWLLLEQGAIHGRIGSIEAKPVAEGDSILGTLDAKKSDVIVGLHPQPPIHGFHDSLNAAAVTEFLGQEGGGRLALVSGKQVFVIEK
jgi:hypothetical protein